MFNLTHYLSQANKHY